MRYVMLICDEHDMWEGLTPEEREVGYNEIYAHIEKWEKLGKYVAGGKELEPPSKARTVRRDGAGGVVVTDGPYTEIKELVGGFMMIEADDMDEAVAVASEWPGIARGAAVEVRPVVEH